MGSGEILDDGCARPLSSEDVGKGLFMEREEKLHLNAEWDGWEFPGACVAIIGRRHLDGGQGSQ